MLGGIYYYCLKSIIFLLNRRLSESYSSSQGFRGYNKVPLEKDLPLCISESTWMLCHIIFRVCTYNNLTKSWEYLPPCQETCDHYIRKNKMCLKTALELLYWSKEIDSCASKTLFFLNCSLYPKRLSGNCQDIPTSKSLYFVNVL